MKKIKIGVQDKNGKEIHEGDIVINANDWAGVIVYFPRECRFTVAEMEEYPNGSIYNSDMINIVGDNWMAHEIQVIGNIYENPELINKLKEIKI